MLHPDGYTAPTTILEHTVMSERIRTKQLQWSMSVQAPAKISLRLIGVGIYIYLSYAYFNCRIAGIAPVHRN